MAAKVSSERTDGQPRLVSVDAAMQEATVAWLRLAVASLAVAGIFALLVAVARTPRIQGLVGEQYFRISLVGHVTFSLNVWLLSLAGALWTMVPAAAGLPGSARASAVGCWLASAGAAAMAVASIAGLGTPHLVDYLPILDHPVFAVGLAIFLAGVGLPAASSLAATWRARQPVAPEILALRMGAVVYLMALATLIVALNGGGRADWATAAWGPGHLLQLVNAVALISAWLLLLPRALPSAARAGLRAVLPLLLVPAAVVPLLYVVPMPLPKGAIGTLTWASLAVPAGAAWLLVAREVVRSRRLSQRWPLLMSLSLFAVGVAVAALGMQGDTRVTAHYHGTVGAVTVALMCLSYRLVPALGLASRLPRLRDVQPVTYGLGLLLLIGGLFWASSFGGQRKAFEAFAHNSSLIGPLGLFGLGAILAVLGGAAFVLAVGVSLTSGAKRQAAPGDEPGIPRGVTEATLRPPMG